MVCQLRFLSVHLVCEVDAFKHLRFCDDFSHSSDYTFSCYCKALLKHHVDGIDV